MYRGSNKFHKNSQNAPLPQNQLTPNQSVNSQLSRRNELIVARYYYHKTFPEQRLAYDYILELLGKEFYLKPTTIPIIIEKHQHVLSELYEKKPTIAYFKRKVDWQHLKW